MGGVFMVGVSADNRKQAGVAGGDGLDVEIELDTEPRVLVVPPDFAAALDADADARASVPRARQARLGWCGSSSCREARRTEGGGVPTGSSSTVPLLVHPSSAPCHRATDEFPAATALHVVRPRTNGRMLTMTDLLERRFRPAP